MSASPRFRISLSYILSTLIPAVLPLSATLLVVTGYIYGLDTAWNKYMSLIMNNRISLGELLLVSLIPSLIALILVGELIESNRSKVPLEFKYILSDETGGDLEDRVPSYKKILLNPGKVYSLPILPPIISGLTLSTTKINFDEGKTPVWAWIFKKSDSAWKFWLYFLVSVLPVSVMASDIKSRLVNAIPGREYHYLYNTIDEDLTTNLTDILGVEREYVKKVENDHHLYECFLSYIGDNKSKRVERRRRRYIFRQNMKTGINYTTILSLLVLGTLLVQTFVRAGWEWSVVGWIIASVMIFSALYYLLGIGFFIYQMFDMYFQNAGKEYMDSLLSDFFVKRRQEKNGYNCSPES